MRLLFSLNKIIHSHTITYTKNDGEKNKWIVCVRVCAEWRKRAREAGKISHQLEKWKPEINSLSLYRPIAYFFVHSFLIWKCLNKRLIEWRVLLVVFCPSFHVIKSFIVKNCEKLTFVVLSIRCKRSRRDFQRTMENKLFSFHDRERETERQTVFMRVSSVMRRIKSVN